jgi:prepilin-type N-terminal cleavage/methylation domain-containing protein
MGRTARHRNGGFTLVELVVVVMILGIVAAIAAPRLLGTSQAASDNGLKQTLSVIRDAIDSYSAKYEALPGADGNEATFKTDLQPYLRGSTFPSCSIGDAKNAAIRMQSGTGSIASGVGATDATHSWAYKYQTGDFHVNSTDLSGDGVTTYDQF